MPTTARRSLVALACAVLVAPLLAITAALTAPAGAATTVSGVDVSGWDHPNGVAIDWAKVRASGRAFAIIKATESTTFTNKYFDADYKQARANGLVVGAYHFARPKLPISSAADQARYYVSTVQRTGSFRWTNTFAPVLDLEVTGGLSRTDLIAWTQRWLDTAKTLTGRTPILYTYDSFVRNTLGNTTRFSKYPLWYARYTTVTPTTSTLPGGWQQWTMWQYTSTGATPGIPDTGDVNLFNGSLTTLRAFADGTRAGLAPPAVVGEMTATPGERSARITWGPVDDDGGAPILRYRVSVDGGPEVFTPTRSFIAVGLTAGTHTVTVRAENLSGISLPRSTSFTVAAWNPDAVITPASVVVSVVAPTTAKATTASTVKVAVRRSDTWQSLASTLVTLQVRQEVGAPWRPIVLRTGADGIATVAVKPSIDAALVGSMASSTWYQGGTASRSVRVVPWVSATASPTRLAVGGRATVTARVSTLLAGETLVRQRYSSGRWSDVGAAVVRADGTAVFSTGAMRTRGDKVYRVRVVSNARHLAAVSRTVTIRVV